MIVAFWVTTECNMQCKYCYEGSEKQNKVMKKEIADKAIEFVPNHLKTLHYDENVLIE